MLIHSVVNNACDMKIYVTWMFCHCEITSYEEQQIKTVELDKYCVSMMTMMMMTITTQQQKQNSEFIISTISTMNGSSLTLTVFL